MKPMLQLNTTQQLVLTPQLQHAIRLLQMSSVELHAEVENILLQNPMLEHDDKQVTEDETPYINTSDLKLREHAEQHPIDSASVTWGNTVHDAEEESDPLSQIPSTTTLCHHLLTQLSEIALSARDRALVQLLIEELDEDGYLPSSLKEIQCALPTELNVDLDELSVALTLLQQFDPPGVAASSLTEALCLQLERLPDHTPGRALAHTLVKDHLELMGNRDYGQLKKILAVEEKELKQAQQLISMLNPRPASRFGGEAPRYIIPDVNVKKKHSRWIAELNEAALPKVRVHRYYAQLLAGDHTSRRKLGTHLQEAHWLVKNIKQRFDTILKVSQAIVQKQQAFFEEGEIAMQPLVLRDIADELGLHESTVSRVVSQKFLYCSRGLFELKYFFSHALETHHGTECSAIAIKAHIRRLINTEPPASPLSDNAITEALVRLGIQVARRTVAKYREAMRIPPACRRKEL